MVYKKEKRIKIMAKVNLINFHILILYKDMIKNKYITEGKLHWINDSLYDAVYLAKVYKQHKKNVLTRRILCLKKLG